MRKSVIFAIQDDRTGFGYSQRPAAQPLHMQAAQMDFYGDLRVVQSPF